MLLDAVAAVPPPIYPHPHMIPSRAGAAHAVRPKHALASSVPSRLLGGAARGRCVHAGPTSAARPAGRGMFGFGTCKYMCRLIKVLKLLLGYDTEMHARTALNCWKMHAWPALRYA